MAERLFIGILNMSLTGSLVILAVLVTRLFLRKAPRIFSYCLWAVVLFRLLCPVSFSADFSLLGALEPAAAEHGRMEYISQDLLRIDAGETESRGGAVGDVSQGLSGGEGVADSSGGRLGSETDGKAALRPETLAAAVRAGTGIWLLGICVMALHGGISLLRLKRKLKGAVREEENLYVTREVTTPFVIGLARPRIYLPALLGEREREYVLLHERIHLERKDHIVKAVSFAALCLHWFNPLVWAAFFLSGKDMEMSCDEAVIRRIGSGVKKEYSSSLLSMATGRRIVSGVPLAFGEGDTGSRIKNVLGYRKPAFLAVAAAALVCGVTAVVLLANPEKAEARGPGEAQGAGQGLSETEAASVVYGVVADIPVEGVTRRLLVIPGADVTDIPAADSVYPYFEREEQGLLPGDMVAITFPAGEEVLFLETWPAQFSSKAESIVVMWGGCGLERAENNAWRLTFAAGVVPGAETARAGDYLLIYQEKVDMDAPAYLSRVPEGEGSVLLARVPILAVGETVGQDPVRALTVELSAGQVRSVFAGFGFSIRFELEAGEGGPSGESGPEGANGPAGRGGSEGKNGLSGENSPEGKNGSLGENGPAGEGTEVSGSLGDAQRGGTGTYRVSVRSVSRSARVIDSYVSDRQDSSEGGEELAFAQDCVFKANYSMDGTDYREISFEEFADLIGEGSAYLNQPCLLTFEEGLIVEAALESAWYPYGIGFSNEIPVSTLYSHLLEEEGEEAFSAYYDLVSTEVLDVADCEGREIIEVYTGNQGDGDSGIVLFKNSDGKLLYTQDAHRARAGWNNIYLGEREGSAFILNVQIEDRWDYGGYAYWVYRLDEEGSPRQIAGSRFDFWLGENAPTRYDDALFGQWAEGMSGWLENSHLILSTQEGEVRTEKVCEADVYNYENLSLKDREAE